MAFSGDMALWRCGEGYLYKSSRRIRWHGQISYMHVHIGQSLKESYSNVPSVHELNFFLFLLEIPQKKERRNSNMDYIESKI